MSKQEEIRDFLKRQLAIEYRDGGLKQGASMTLGRRVEGIIEYLHSQGVVISSNRDSSECESCPVAVVCGYVAVESLIKEGE